jgi:hypothetical protein
VRHVSHDLSRLLTLLADVRNNGVDTTLDAPDLRFHFTERIVASYSQGAADIFCETHDICTQALQVVADVGRCGPGPFFLATMDVSNTYCDPDELVRWPTGNARRRPTAALARAARVCTWLLSGPGGRLFCWRRRERFSPKPSPSIANHSKPYDCDHNNTPHDALILKHFPELPFAQFLSPVAQW